MKKTSVMLPCFIRQLVFKNEIDLTVLPSSKNCSSVEQVFICPLGMIIKSFLAFCSLSKAVKATGKSLGKTTINPVIESGKKIMLKNDLGISKSLSYLSHKAQQKSTKWPPILSSLKICLKCK